MTFTLENNWRGNSEFVWCGFAAWTKPCCERGRVAVFGAALLGFCVEFTCHYRLPRRHRLALLGTVFGILLITLLAQLGVIKRYRPQPLHRSPLVEQVFDAALASQGLKAAR